jgi:hypothetical protein
MNQQFHALCETLCRLADVPPPTLTATQEGVESFTLQADDVNVSFVSQPPSDTETETDRVLLMVDLGQSAADDHADVCRSLLSANFFLMNEPGSARFSLNESTGGFILHQDLALGAMSHEAVYARALQLVEFVKAWRERPLPARPADLHTPRADFA